MALPIADHSMGLRDKLIQAITKYGFDVVFSKLDPPNTGSFNGLRITVDPRVDYAMSCFLLLHLFGHSVQWTAPIYELALNGVKNATNMKYFMSDLYRYEMDAARYGMGLLSSVWCDDRALDQWYADAVATDWQYVKKFYETAMIPDLKDCTVTGADLIESSMVPRLILKEVEVRFAF